MHTPRTLCEGEGRAGVTPVQIKISQRLPANCQRLAGQGTKQILLPGTNPANTSIWNSQPSQPETTEPCCLSHPVCVLYYSSPSKLIQPTSPTLCTEIQQLNTSMRSASILLCPRILRPAETCSLCGLHQHVKYANSTRTLCNTSRTSHEEGGDPVTTATSPLWGMNHNLYESGSTSLQQPVPPAPPAEKQVKEHCPVTSLEMFTQRNR